MFRTFLGVVVAFSCAPESFAAISNPFDRAIGSNAYWNLDNGNWQTSFAGLTPRAGNDFIATSNGNPPGPGFTSSILKNLGGSISNETYEVGFFVSKYEDSGLSISGINFSDFLRLRIGGPAGVMNWHTTPSPTINNVWVEWRGTYVPASTDLGRTFQFDAMWQLNGRTSLAIDGPMIAIVPEPGALVLAPLAVVFLFRRCVVPKVVPNRLAGGIRERSQRSSSSATHQSS